MVIDRPLFFTHPPHMINVHVTAFQYNMLEKPPSVFRGSGREGVTNDHVIKPD